MAVAEAEAVLPQLVVAPACVPHVGWMEAALVLHAVGFWVVSFASMFPPSLVVMVAVAAEVVEGGPTGLGRPALSSLGGIRCDSSLLVGARSSFTCPLHFKGGHIPGSRGQAQCLEGVTLKSEGVTFWVLRGSPQKVRGQAVQGPWGHRVKSGGVRHPFDEPIDQPQ